MSTIITTNLKNASSNINNLVLNTDGSAKVNGSFEAASSIKAASNILNASGNPILQQTGSILQVVQATTTTVVTISTTAYTDSNLTATITPTSATSKVLILVSQQYAYYRTAATTYFGTRLMRGATAIHTPTNIEVGQNLTGVTNTAYFPSRYSLMYLDSPATTSATTYKTQGSVNDITLSGSVQYQPEGPSYIILIEVAA